MLEANPKNLCCHANLQQTLSAKPTGLDEPERGHTRSWAPALAVVRPHCDGWTAISSTGLVIPLSSRLAAAVKASRCLARAGTQCARPKSGRMIVAPRSWVWSTPSARNGFGDSTRCPQDATPCLLGMHPSGSVNRPWP